MAIQLSCESGKGILGGLDSSLGVPPASLSFSQGSQLNDVTQFVGSGQTGGQVPIYTYVIEGVPRIQISTERGVLMSPNDLAQQTGTVWAKFLTINGTTRPTIKGAEVDPAGTASTGANGASVSFIKTASCS